MPSYICFPTMPPKATKADKKKQVLETADDYMEAAIEEEDQGDRWIASDLAKGVRFYERAFGLYNQVLSRTTSEELIVDARYNMLRMQFFVYTKVVKSGYLPEIQGKIANESGGNQVVVGKITDLVQLFRELISTASSRDDVDIDVLFNYAQVLTEAGEEEDNAGYLTEACQVFEAILARQMPQLEAIIQSFGSQESESVNEPSNDELEKVGESAKQDAPRYAKQSEAVVPATVLETLVSLINSITSIYELDQPIDMDHQSDLVVNQIQALMAMNLPDSLKLEASAIDEALVAIAKLRSAQLLARQPATSQVLEQLQSIWSDPAMASATSASRFLAQSDIFQDFAHQATSGSEAWQGLGQAAKSIDSPLQAAISSSSGTSNISTQEKIRLWIQRGDIEFARSQLDYEASIKHRSVLERNAQTYYRNASNVQSLGAGAAELHLEASVKMQLVGNNQIDIPAHLLPGIQEMGLLNHHL